MQGIFFGTFLIGLREGLEAALIVSIVAAFLKRNGQSIRPMFIGVVAAVVVSIAVAVGLNSLEQSLPQAQQEMLETVIGAIAVVFVTTMIIWMNRNAAKLKGELERDAQAAMASGSIALAAMAFLAVLKEGFETAVFLLAAAQASHGSRTLAVSGATLGIVAAIAIGVGIYRGAVSVNLGRFFRVTGVFLVLIAAGLVMSSLRTAHEAGWVTVGQRQVFDFSSWMSTRSVLGALITGMFGIPPDPRLIEVLGWVLYAVPVLLVFLTSSRFARAPARTRGRVLAAVAACLALAAAALAIFTPLPTAPFGPSRTLTDDAGDAVTLTLAQRGEGRILTIERGASRHDVELSPAGQQTVGDTTAEVWQATTPTNPAVDTTPVSLRDLAGLTGGRLPVGISAARTPGPFDATWSASTVYTVHSVGDSLLSADAASNRTARLSGGGLASPKTVSVGTLPGDWSTGDIGDAGLQLTKFATGRADQMLWKAWLPALLTLGAGLLALRAVQAGRSSRDDDERKRQRHGEEVRHDHVSVR